MTLPGSKVMSFKMSGERYDFDFDEKLLTGDQTEIIRDITGNSAASWIRRVAQWDFDTFDERDLMLVAFLARYRDNELLEWRHFIKQVSPLMIELVEEPAAHTTEAAVTRSRPRKAPATDGE